jgi:glycosyltransferase involved in cell wall biosynthesis
MTQPPLISVIVPAYQAARTLKDALSSVFSQGYTPLEILVIDDGSTDETAALAARFGPPVVCLRQENAGPAAARNCGLRAARGELIAFLDADDLWPPNKLAVQVARLLEDPELDVVQGRIAYLGFAAPAIALEAEGTVPGVHLGGALFRRRVFTRVGLFDPALRRGEDQDFFLRAREAGVKLTILDCVTLLYRHRQGSITDGNQLARELPGLLKRSLERRRQQTSGGAAAPLPSWSDSDEAKLVGERGQGPLTSVIIPAYQAEPFLAEAIDSVLVQAVRPLEVIVVDDGSTDRTFEVARGFRQVRTLRQENRGIAAARNAGIAAARGDFFAFLDADDTWPAGRLTRQLAPLARDPGLDMVFGQVEIFKQSRDSEPPISVGVQGGPLPGSMVVRAASFHRVGLFSQNFRVGEFIDWYMRAEELGLKSVTLPEVVLRRRIHGDNIGIREAQAQVDYVRVLKAALDRRRGRGAGDAK